MAVGHLGAAIVNSAFLGFFCDFGSQEIWGKHMFSSLTHNQFLFKNYVYLLIISLYYYIILNEGLYYYFISFAVIVIAFINLFINVKA